MKWLDIQKELSDLEIAQLEQSLNIKLPEDYKKIIGKINGGALKNASVGNIAFSRNISLHREARFSAHDIIPIINVKEIILFPFASTGNGDYFCFDLKLHKVVLYIHEIPEFRYVCDTYSQLLEMIKEN